MYEGDLKSPCSLIKLIYSAEFRDYTSTIYVVCITETNTIIFILIIHWPTIPLRLDKENI